MGFRPRNARVQLRYNYSVRWSCIQTKSIFLSTFFHLLFVRFMLFSFFVVNVAVSAASEYMIFTQKLSTVWIQSPYTSIHRSPAEIGAKSFILSWPSRITQVVVTLFYMIFLAWFKWLICKFRTPCFCQFSTGRGLNVVQVFLLS